MAYIVSILITICIWAILGITWNLLAGYGKIIALCHSVFFGVGAYATAIIMIDLGWNFFPAMAVGMIMAAVVALLIALPSLRVHSDYFAVISLAFLYVFYNTINNIGITGAADGIKNIPQPTIFGWTISSSYAFLPLCLLLLIISYLIIRQISKSAFGRTLLASGVDELAASSVGKNVVNVKVTGVLISAAVAAIAGSLYATYMRYINADSFFLNQTFLVACIVILGGFKSIIGSVLGAIILILIPELMRFTGLADNLIGPLQGLFYGAVLVGIMIFRPQGLIGKKNKAA
jgi:branched-chain amino acid transport system permease protein